LERFGSNIRPPEVGWAVGKSDVTRVMIVFDEEVFRVDVFGVFGAGNVAVLG
jgi:hypothetical protein